MVAPSSKRADNYDEIKQLVAMCRAGRLFEVQSWIAEGKPVNLPPTPESKARRRCPLQWAIDKGFHSLVQVLLEAGAQVADGSYNALQQALFKRRLDLIKLLVSHGADIHSVDMGYVFETWDPAFMEYFIEQGADVDSGYPLAGALCYKVRTALGVFRRHKDRFPSFQEQANMALRHHCREGNLKWVSLLLWAGADPFAKGPDSPWAEPYPEEDLCALELAAQYEHFEIFKLKNVRINPDHPIATELLLSACRAEQADHLIELIAQGFGPARQKDQGSSLIQACIWCLNWALGRFGTGRNTIRDMDTSRSRETLKMIHILAKNGAKWIPADMDQITRTRRCFLAMSPDYTVEFIWIMSKYQSCRRADVEQLLKTPAIRKIVKKHQPRIDELLNQFET